MFSLVFSWASWRRRDRGGPRVGDVVWSRSGAGGCGAGAVAPQGALRRMGRCGRLERSDGASAPPRLPMAPERGLRAAVEVAQRWRDRPLRPTYQNTGWGLFLSAVDLASGRQESYLLQPGAGGCRWATVAGLEPGAAQGVAVLRRVVRAKRPSAGWIVRSNRLLRQRRRSSKAGRCSCQAMSARADDVERRLRAIAASRTDPSRAGP